MSSFSHLLNINPQISSLKSRRSSSRASHSRNLHESQSLFMLERTVKNLWEITALMHSPPKFLPFMTLEQKGVVISELGKVNSRYVHTITIVRKKSDEFCKEYDLCSQK